jgi:plastocyanin
MGHSRREFLKAGGLALAGYAFAPARQLRSATTLEVIEMRSDSLGSRVWFDPLGLQVAPGTTVRWVVRENVHTTTAYHPQNDHHSLRIPERAAPWDSGFLVRPGAHFDVTLIEPGVYDYYCAPHEAAGMVGRIVVGKPRGPGGEPFDYRVGKPGTQRWRNVPDAARSAFPSVQRILAERRVRPAASRRHDEN